MISWGEGRVKNAGKTVTMDSGSGGKDSGTAKDSGGKHDAASNHDAKAGGDSGGGDSGAGGVCDTGVTTGMDACDTCLSGIPACCTAVSACNADTTCSGCLGGTTTTGCDTSTLLTAVDNSCNMTTGTCATPCTPPPPVNTCNPLTNAECVAQMGAGATCDASLGGGYACFAGPGNDIALCAACDNMGTTFCGPGLTCLPTGTGSAGVCVQYCCTDADCGGVADSCNLTLTETGLGGGLCVTGVPAGDAGAHDAGTHDAEAKDAAHDAEHSDAAAGPKPVCTGIPATPPSAGSCIMFSPDAGTSADGG